MDERAVREARLRAATLSGSLAVHERKTGPVWYGVWRDSTRKPVMKKLGPAWLEARAKPVAQDGEAWRAQWVKRKGYTADGHLDAKAAGLALAEAMLRQEERLATAPERTVRPTAREDLAAAAEAWLSHRQRVKGLRASTLADYRRALRSRILPSSHLAKPVADITTGDVIRWRDELDDLRDPATGERRLTPRTINKMRMMLNGIFEFACRPRDQGGFGLAANPVRYADKLAEDDPAEREPLEPHEVLAVARVLREGRHRLDRTPAGGKFVRPEEVERRRLEDDQDAAAILAMAFTGMRRGELLALRWKHVRFAEGRIRVERSYSYGVETSTKGREARWAPLPDQVAEPLARLGQRPWFTGDDDLVFCNAVGDRIDGSALRRRFFRACEVAGLRRTRMHDLRHSFTTEARQEFGPDQVQKFAGHKDARTAQRYTHARDQTDAAQRMTRYLTERIARR